ncbi:alpha/beta hydrolase [Aminipila sp.]|uniref:alpha/beta hydrolase n=1 Tax=Aminipila sp. TaxID=2060095 RepID=UPI0028A147F9|nr:alpha/beta hydrolase [Aminipila sp.]
MEKEYIKIKNQNVVIPAVLWGKENSKLFIAVHGNMSNKEDSVISILAEKAVEKGYKVVSFDLPMHGERVKQKYECNPQNCVSDLLAVYEYAKEISQDISLFSCSMGAYFSLLAYRDFGLKQALFLSPVVNMEQIIHNMMAGFGVSEERLQKEKIIELPIGQNLEWDYFSYVKANPIDFEWNTPTAILYGTADNLCEWKEISSFTERYHVNLQVLEQGEHYFHTQEQLAVFNSWIDNNLI